MRIWQAGSLPSQCLPVPPMPPSASRCSFHFAIVTQMSDENLKKHKNN